MKLSSHTTNDVINFKIKTETIINVSVAHAFKIN